MPAAIGKPRLLAVFIIAASAAHASRTQDLQLRLESPLASFSRPGTTFTARVLGATEPGPEPVLPAGSVIHGTVKEAHSIGLGLRRERAGLVLEFDGCRLPDGRAAYCDVQLLGVDNARETVHKNNRIRGMLAASHPPSMFSGLWYRPAPAILLRPVSGLAGAGGMLVGHLAPGPVGAGIFVISRMILFRIPDPEISLPAGTDLIARISTPEEYATPAPSDVKMDRSAWPEGFAEWLDSVPREIRRPDGLLMTDMINIALLGTEPQLASAFAAAGWQGADALNTRNFGKTYSAYVGMKSYQRAPVSTLHYQGRPPDLVFQKSFNTLSQRHHIRLWKLEQPDGSLVWLGAATHDVGVAFDWNRLNITHRIDQHIDRERSKVVNDLSAVGCLAGIHSVAGSAAAPRRPRGSDGAITDGALAAGRIGACDAEPAATPALVKPKHRSIALSLRRVILESKYYFIRCNAYSFAYQTVRWAFVNPRALARNGPYAAALK